MTQVMKAYLLSDSHPAVAGLLDVELIAAM